MKPRWAAMLFLTGKVSVVDGSSALFIVTPCRAADTRTASDPLVANTIRGFTVAGACGVPADARAVVANLTAVNPGEFGDLRVYAVIPLGIGGALAVYYDAPPNSTATTHFVLDVYGYMR
jgi:hypothetical protein